jgi:hypothetical protein
MGMTITAKIIAPRFFIDPVQVFQYELLGGKGA